jgi:hypothetical protein
MHFKRNAPQNTPMKLIATIFALVLITNSMFAQSDANQGIAQNEYPIVEIHLTEQIDAKVYTFVSNLQHDEYKIPLFIKRMKDKFSEILELEIDSITQQVVLKLQVATSEERLLDIIKKFKYSSYEIK